MHPELPHGRGAVLFFGGDPHVGRTLSCVTQPVSFSLLRWSGRPGRSPWRAIMNWFTGAATDWMGCYIFSDQCRVTTRSWS